MKLRGFQYREMSESDFRDLIKKHVLPMFTGAELFRDRLLRRRVKRYATLLTNQTMLINWPGLLRRFAIKRSQYFERADANLVHNYINNLSKARRLFGTETFDDSIDPSMRRAIARQIAPQCSKLVANLITHFEQWAQQTYEGRPISAAIGIDPHNPATSGIKVMQQLTSPYGIVIANGLESFLTISRDGQLLERITVKPDRTFESIRSPIRFVSLARWAEKDRLAIALTRNGEILLFKNRTLVFAKRRGAWRHFPLKPIIARARLKSHFPRPLVEALIITCLDVSFAKTGGGLGLIASRALKSFRRSRIVAIGDMLGSTNPKPKFLSILVHGRKFQDLDRWLRMDLAAIDGSTILERDGSICAAGAILKISAGSRGGGRQSAAETVGRYGLGVKVSSDGEIKGYWSSNHRKKPKELFAFG